MTDPIGVNKITCPVNSDTIVGIPFRKEGSRSTVTSASPINVVGEPDLKEIPLSALTLEAGSLTQHYLKFDSGSRDGRWYDITANTATSVTIDLNGDTLDGVTTGDRVTIAEYWTLNTLFPPANATGDPTTTGHAVVGSNGTGSRNRKTEILYPDLLGLGINRAAPSQYYI
ncbi:MAG: TIGR02597 family protein, partial [Opitutales bacterium]